jgi:hypothetical protein
MMEIELFPLDGHTEYVRISTSDQSANEMENSYRYISVPRPFVKRVNVTYFRQVCPCLSERQISTLF